MATDAVSPAATIKYLVHRAGIRADVLTSGTIATGAEIVVDSADSGITFRPLQEADLPLLTDWLNKPHVREWWSGDDAAADIDATRRKYLPRMNDDSPVKAYVAALADEPIGFIQSYVALDAAMDGGKRNTTPAFAESTSSFATAEDWDRD